MTNPEKPGIVSSTLDSILTSTLTALSFKELVDNFEYEPSAGPVLVYSLATLGAGYLTIKNLHKVYKGLGND